MKSLSLVGAVLVLLASVPGWAQQPSPSPPSNLESGGLRPPEAIDGAQQTPPEANAAATEKELEQADHEDSGRGLEWVWANAEVGVEHVGLGTLKTNKLLDPAVKTTQTGLMFGGGLGVRVWVFTAGARFRMGTFSEWKLWTLDAEGGFHIPLGQLEPHFTLGVGYASLGSFSSKSLAESRADVRGLNVRLGAGIDYYLSNTFSVGGNLSGDALFLSRAAKSGTTPSAGAADAALYAQDGSSIGLGGSLTLVLGLHF